MGWAILLCTNLGLLAFVVLEAEVDGYMPWDIYVRIYRFAFFSILTFMNLHTMVAYLQVRVTHFPLLHISKDKHLSDVPLQVCVIKHVKEIDDELCNTIIVRMVVLTHLWGTFLLPTNPHMYNNNLPELEDNWKNLLHPLETR